MTQQLLRRSFLSPTRRNGLTTDIPEHWQPPDPWKGRPSHGQPLASGRHPAELYSKDWHRFNWLRDMREYGGSQSRTLARRFILEWIDQNQNWSRDIWHPQLLAERIRILVLTWGWFGASANTAQQQSIINSLKAQHVMLKKDWRGLTGGNARITTLTAQILAQAFLEKDADPTNLADGLIAETRTLILADGCHASRQPDLHIQLLLNLIEAHIGLGAMITRLDEAQPQTLELLSGLDDTIARMGAIARMWRHGGGQLMAILGSHDVAENHLNDVLDRAGSKGRIENHASDSGFIRMASGRSVLMMNTGPAPWALPRIIAEGGKPDAGALAVEFSNGQNQIIVNAGQKKSLFLESPDLAIALAGTAAFSTLTIDRTNSADVTATTAEGRHAAVDNAETGPASGGLLAIAQHDGYEKTHGIVHQRRVFLSTGGNDLRGEDTISYTGAPGHIPNDATIRFHLHPRINAVMSRGGDVILQLPGGATPWIFKARGGNVDIEDSIVLGKDGIQKCAQITLTTPLATIRTDHTKTIKWAMRRQVKAKPATGTKT
jgi:uncharacterized heparinase superfamily protein